MKKKYQYSNSKMKRGLNSIVKQIGDEKFDYIVGLSRGGLVPAVYLSHSLVLPMLALDYSIRDNQVVGYETRKVIKDIVQDLVTGEIQKRILIVEDIIDSGKTLHSLFETMKTLNPNINFRDNVRVASLIYQKGNKYGAKADYFDMLHDVKHWIVFPWEMT